MGYAVTYLETGGRLHPGVKRKYPERRERRAGCDQHRRRSMHLVGYATESEEHDTQEDGFQKECSQHLVTKQRSGDVADLFHVTRPVGAELETHRDAGYDAHRE